MQSIGPSTCPPQTLYKWRVLRKTRRPVRLASFRVVEMSEYPEEAVEHLDHYVNKWS